MGERAQRLSTAERAWSVSARRQPSARSAAAERVVPPALWRLFTVSFLAFLAFPVHALPRMHLSPMRLLIALAGMAAFSGLYLWLMLHEPFRAAPLSPREVHVHLALLGALTAVVVALTLAYGVDFIWYVLYANMAAAMKLPVRIASVTIVGLTASTMGIAAATLGAVIDGTVSTTITSVSGCLIIVSWMVTTIQELRAARQEIARLAVVEAVTEERLRFARDLHDLLGRSLSTITLKNELARRTLRDDPERAAREITDAIGLAREALAEVREAVAGYRHPTLASEMASAREVLAAAGIACDVDASGDPLPPVTEAVLAWAVREGVTNVVRHSRARRCAIRVTRADGIAAVEVTDDGAATPSSPGRSVNDGTGLCGLAERAARVGGAVEAGPVEAGGFRLRVALPLGDDAGVRAEERRR